MSEKPVPVEPDEEIEAPEINREIRTRAAEHEVFLSFNSDWHAEAFTDWWQEEGLKAFRAWATSRVKEYDSSW